MDHSTTNSPVASPPDPPQDHSATSAPSNIEIFLHAVGILLTYGRHLIDTVRHHATAPRFNAIAAGFGTGNLSTILAHLNRGILRAAALERILLARIAAGKDIDMVLRRPRAPQEDPAPTSAQPEPTAAEPTTHKRAPRPARPAGWDDPELFMPTLEELERQVRRRPAGRTIFDICLDLAVVPMFCHSAFWNELFELMTCFGGSIDKLMREKARRREAFGKEQDRKRDSNWDWLRLKRDDLRQVLGFFIGEPPINPFDPAAAVA